MSNIYNAESLLKEFLDSECYDYGIKYEIEFTEEYEEYLYFCINIWHHEKENSRWIHFKVNPNKGELYIDVSNEDNWELIKHFDCTAKYFWIALLDWPKDF